jgi:hypothetical protein
VRPSLPVGYVYLSSTHGQGVASESLAAPLSKLLDSGAVYEHAGKDPDKRTLVGRGPAYAIRLAGTPLVVRHARHGGLLAWLTRDLFMPPTRAPYELSVSIRLREAGVPTPEVLAYIVYPAGPMFRRADIVTREIQAGIDLGSCLGADAPDDIDRRAVWDAVRTLIVSLGRVGAFHADLNVKNILITGANTPAPLAYALDVDRVVWRKPGDPAVVRANTARLHRSAEKRGLL